MRSPADRFRGVLARLRGMIRRGRAEREMEEELRFHVEMETEQNIRRGMEPREARRRALASFGGWDRHREGLRRGREIPVVEPIWRDARFAARALARSPGLSLVAALTIGLGVGASTAVFTLVDWALFDPLPMPGVERLVSIQEDRSGTVSTGVEGMLIPFRRYEAYRDRTRDVFESVAAFRTTEFSLRLPDVTLGVQGALTSGGFFGTLGIEPVRGRAYGDDFAAEVVISHGLWRDTFGGRDDVIGLSVAVDGHPVTIVGVAPPEFRGTTLYTEAIWVPAGIRGEAMHDWNSRIVPIARIREGIDRDRAAAVAAAVGEALPTGENAVVRGVVLEPMKKLAGGERGIAAGFLAMLLGTALVVLLIAAANLAAVMLARSAVRRRELAIRRAIGAGRTRLIRHLLAESLLLFGLGGGLGVGFAWLGVGWLRSIPLPPHVPIAIDLAPDGRVLLFALLVTGVTGLVFGLVPALQASRPDLLPALRDGGRGASGARDRLRRLFVGGQVALAVLLLVTAALFTRSLQAGLGTDLGFEPDGVVFATVDVGPPHNYDGEARIAFYRTLSERLRALPGVEAVGLSRYVPVSGGRSATNVRAVRDTDATSVHVAYSDADPGFIEALRYDLVAGRNFTDADNATSRRVAIVNRRVAEVLFPGESAVGRELLGMGSEPLEIIGVIENGRYVSVTEEETGFVFRSYAQSPAPAMGIHARAPGREAETLAAMRREIRRLDPDVAMSSAGTLESVVWFSLIPQRIAAQLVGVFGLVGLFLAAMGVYGVLAFHVAQRTRELGIRRALGAGRRDVVGAVVRNGLTMAAGGCVAGAVAAALFARALEGFLFGIRPLDPLTFVSVPVMLLAVALCASAVPALRAVAVSPVVALRDE